MSAIDSWNSINSTEVPVGITLLQHRLRPLAHRFCSMPAGAPEARQQIPQDIGGNGNLSWAHGIFQFILIVSPPSAVWRRPMDEAIDMATCLSQNRYSREVCCFVGWLLNVTATCVSRGRICSDNFTCCHTEMENADRTFHLTQSRYTDTRPTSPSTDPITPGAWQVSH